MTIPMNPLPSLIRASAWDAANARARKAGRAAWSRGDYNAACYEQERLIRHCYGRPNDEPDSKMPFIRFAIAEQMQRAGKFGLCDDFRKISAVIDASLSA